MDYNTIKHLERGVTILERGAFSAEHEMSWRREIARLLGDEWSDNVMKCSDCGTTEVPLAMTEGGSSPEYTCAVCIAKRKIAEYDN